MARAFCNRLADQGIACKPSGPIEIAAHADVIVTTTPATQPVLRRDWLSPGVHINAMGADTAGKQEHEVATLRDAHMVVDDWAQTSGLGQCQHAVRAELFSDAQHPPTLPVTSGRISFDGVSGRTITQLDQLQRDRP